MYLHIGNDYSVLSKDVIGIFDIENTSISKGTKDFFANASKMGRVVYTTYDMPKSFVVCLDKNLDEKVYVSLLSCATLRKRLNKTV